MVSSVPFGACTRFLEIRGRRQRARSEQGLLASGRDFRPMNSATANRLTARLSGSDQGDHCGRHDIIEAFVLSLAIDQEPPANLLTSCVLGPQLVAGLRCRPLHQEPGE